MKIESLQRCFRDRLALTMHCVKEEIDKDYFQFTNDSLHRSEFFVSKWSQIYRRYFIYELEKKNDSER